ncbi:MAG: CPBP family intramembrane glutamic endopeptidase [Eubacteriales bacterium]
MNIIQKDKGYINGLWLFFVLFVIFIIGNILIGLYLREFALYHEILDILIPMLVYLWWKKKPFITALKLHKSLNRESIIIICILFLVSFLLKYGINYFVLLTGFINPTEVTSKVMEMVPNLFTFFIAVAVIPVFLEEFIIRGVTLNEFTDTSLWQSAIMTGLLFGMMHVNLGQLGYTTALGIIMAAIVITTGSIWGSILFHFLNNFLSFAVLGGIKILEGYIPTEVTNEIIHGQGNDMLQYNNIFTLMVGVFIAGIALVGGILLTYHLIKKLERENDYTEQPRVSWARLFFNVPFMLILTAYIGVNILFY